MSNASEYSKNACRNWFWRRGNFVANVDAMIIYIYGASVREYWMIYKRPGFLAVVWFAWAFVSVCMWNLPFGLPHREEENGYVREYRCKIFERVKREKVDTWNWVGTKFRIYKQIFTRAPITVNWAMPSNNSNINDIYFYSRGHWWGVLDLWLQREATCYRNRCLGSFKVRKFGLR